MILYGLLIAGIYLGGYFPVFVSSALHGSRLASFPVPDFTANFTLHAQQGRNSSKQIRHGLSSEPVYVRVFAVAVDGNNQRFSFEAVGSSQDFSRQSAYGGLIYAYNSEYVRVWAPTDPNGHLIFIKDGWGGEINTQESDEAIVFVEAWINFPEPTFELDLAIDRKESYHEVDHELRQIPELVVVKVYPKSGKNPSQGYWFPGIAASQNPNTREYGGVIFAYNERKVRLWAPHQLQTGCVFIGNGWAGGLHSQRTTQCSVRVQMWVNQLPVPVFKTDWFIFEGQAGPKSFREVSHNLGTVPSLVIVQLQARDGINKGYVFQGQGAVQCGDDNSDGYGGVAFAYNNESVRLWAPSRNSGTKKGYPLLVKGSSWGNGKYSQDDGLCYDVLVRVVVYSGTCNETMETAFVGNQCLNTLYGSYKGWKREKQWSDCSSICNSGVQKRALTGCQATAKKILHSWDFETDDLDGWSAPRRSFSGSEIRWRRTNSSTPVQQTGPMWGHPKGSFYMYTNAMNAVPQSYAFLRSPLISRATKCYLHFFWSMYGAEVGTLSVEAKIENTRNSNVGWRDSGWSMTGNQGPVFWRAGYINLEGFNSIYGIRFKHALPKKEVCNNRSCSRVNVAVDAVRLECEVDVDDLSTAECYNRAIPFAGCPRDATAYDSKGPAYGTESAGSETYVKASGSKGDIIASYDFQVLYAAQYVLWKETFSTSNGTNNISFRVDEGEWNNWETIRRGAYSVWAQYYIWPFTLMPGKHTVTLRQVEPGFRLRRLMLAPKNISMWTDLGMQSRHIPDSYLTAHPKANSLPAPRFGRLNGETGWCSSDQNPIFVYFQVKLPDFALLTRIAIQGYRDDSTKITYWVKSFRMKVSIDGNKFSWYRELRPTKTFSGNTNADDVNEHVLSYAVPVRAVRIFPMNWTCNLVCLRVELYGFYFPRGLCSSPGKAPATTQRCTGDRNCGKNMGCQKSVLSNYVQLYKNTTDNQEECNCLRGFHGPMCEYHGCSPNPCKNNGTCHDVTKYFTCTCSPGYHGNLCQHPCKQGYYGKDCAHKCQCSVHGSCDLATGHCNCKRGYNGTYCEERCAPGFYGYGCEQACPCQNGASCDAVSGSCNCSVGWTGTFCELRCPKNMWGESCNKSCSCASTAVACDRFTGQCFCKDGFFGKTCELECPRGLYGRNCSYSCQCKNGATCSKADGTCNCTTPGFTGVLCDKPCHAGYFGVNCAQRCHCHRGSCDRVTGDCICPIGWSGATCNSSCPQRFWGRNCTRPCSCTHGAQCNPANGKCECIGNCKCDAGWTGVECNVPCPLGTWGLKCFHACACANGGKCNKVSGSCSCRAGYSGSQCEFPCAADHYGVNCRHICSCSSNASTDCDSVSGACRCKAGWQGQTCNIPCPGGLWGINCSKACDCVHGSCDPVTGNCTCERGWQGSNCSQSCGNCGSPCHCYHGNSSAVSSCGTCLCLPGYQGSSCLEACPAGYYGNLCKSKCACDNGALCDNLDGSCDCAPGWTGPQCKQGCSSGKFGRGCNQTCACEHGTCDPVSGVCSCEPGYHGDRCDEPCPLGTFGKDCQSKCRCENGAVCDHVTGNCTCAVGWRGHLCNVTCTRGFYGKKCSERCNCRGASCDHVSGTCSCPAGLYGPLCAQACPVGFYGAGCSRTCTCQNGASCDHVNGTCTCTPGWNGSNCSLPCPHQRYGMLCASACDCGTNFTEPEQPCDHVTGKCNCRPGYQGPNCLEQCLPGMYGKDCQNNCTCQNGGDCSPSDGTCSCLAGFHGNNCQLPCPPRHYGILCNSTCNCLWQKTESCSPKDGFCSCKRGYAGVMCENPCSEGKFGPGCSLSCACQNGAHCDHVHGRCTCVEGYFGRNCSEPCPKGTFGRGCSRKCVCKNGAKCDPITGRCQCAKGFEGMRCSAPCKGGRYGVNCTGNCDCDEGNTKSCDNRDGTCVCEPGFTGVRCDKICSYGSYGQNCAETCSPDCIHFNGTCNHVKGNCSCLPGYRTYFCRDDCPLDRYGLHCAEICKCAPKLCHHVDGACLDASRGKFELFFDSSVAELDLDPGRVKLKHGLETLMKKFFDRFENLSPPAPTPVKLPDALENVTLGRKTIGSARHDFMVRLLSLQAEKAADGRNVARGEFVLLDDHIVVDGEKVLAVLNRIPLEKIETAIVAEIYSGPLYQEPPTESKIKSHLPLIIGSSVGFVFVVLIVGLFTATRRGPQTVRGGQWRTNDKTEAEMELQPRPRKSTDPFRLAFQNPYYDILAAMGLDDDLEEEFYNPLYEDASVCSDTTDDSYPEYLSDMVIRV